MSNTETPPRSIKQRIKDGDKISHNKVPTNASREQVHEFIAEHTPDMIYLDVHHSPITEWDISRICQAGQEKDTPVMMRIKHANPASLISSLLDIGVFSIKVPTVEDEATVDAIIDAFTILRLANAALAAPTTTAKERRIWVLTAVPTSNGGTTTLCLVSSSKHSRGCSMLVTWLDQASTMLILAHRTWVTILQSSSTLVSKQSLLARTS